jgi:hypothetical protein
MSRSAGMPDNSSGNTSKKLINHWHLGSLANVQLILLHTVGNAFSCNYRLCDILNSFSSCVVSLIDSLGHSMGILCLLNQSYSKNNLNALSFQINKVDDKVYPPYFQI